MSLLQGRRNPSLLLKTGALSWARRRLTSSCVHNPLSDEVNSKKKEEEEEGSSTSLDIISINHAFFKQMNLLDPWWVSKQ
ncbi:unnamed protein product [Blepharisma stoltei]|uniref:Uncharacterized protein n=1 Tax=Blepharisma stoltei TaxID=1481888 RepID=A0AAU9JC17_9CILI|nr:unnamed protein product [Blepharisma stoltei]